MKQARDRGKEKSWLRPGSLLKLSLDMSQKFDDNVLADQPTGYDSVSALCSNVGWKHLMNLKNSLYLCCNLVLDMYDAVWPVAEVVNIFRDYRLNLIFMTGDFLLCRASGYFSVQLPCLMDLV